MGKLLSVGCHEFFEFVTSCGEVEAQIVADGAVEHSVQVGQSKRQQTCEWR